MFNNSTNMRLLELRRESPQDLITLVDTMLEASRRVPLDHIRHGTFKHEFLQATSEYMRPKGPVDTSIRRKTIILAGYTGAGKSTLANCLFNQQGSLYHVQTHPFPTSDRANGCTAKATMLSNSKYDIIDTVGFADPRFNQTAVIETFQAGLALVNSTVDLILFVMKQDRVGKALDTFFTIFKNEVFRNRMVDNSVLICNNCREGWLADNRLDNEFLDEILDNCNNRSFEFQLDFVSPQIKMPPNARDAILQTYEDSRQRAIDELIAYLDALEVKKVNLNYIQDAQFKVEFIDDIAKKLIEANSGQFARTINKATDVARVLGVGASLITLGVNALAYVNPVLSALSISYCAIEGLIFLANGGERLKSELVPVDSKPVVKNKCLISIQLEEIAQAASK